ncbi:hypothetical protein PAPYR_4944 [Paratrimastix pyriformis]|uniref:L-dopachrome isomerase n=1 Tax=Paratrimastix pyriformis TaxID=342808 RepID=A0ABQ8UIT7_9EUKA|nr:hypothetical protein PAPYR_4944 [Paratrimastix pyriformis]
MGIPVGNSLPYAQILTNAPLDESKKADICKAVSRILGQCIGKPEDYVMVSCQSATMCMAGDATAPAAFVTVKSIGGLNPRVNARISEQIGNALIAQCSGLTGERIYMTFTNEQGSNWGWNLATF